MPALASLLEVSMVPCDRDTSLQIHHLVILILTILNAGDENHDNFGITQEKSKNSLKDVR